MYYFTFCVQNITIKNYTSMVREHSSPGYYECNWEFQTQPEAIVLRSGELAKPVWDDIHILERPRQLLLEYFFIDFIQQRSKALLHNSDVKFGTQCPNVWDFSVLIFTENGYLMLLCINTVSHSKSNQQYLYLTPRANCGVEQHIPSTFILGQLSKNGGETSVYFSTCLPRLASCMHAVLRDTQPRTPSFLAVVIKFVVALKTTQSSSSSTTTATTVRVGVAGGGGGSLKPPPVLGINRKQVPTRASI